LDTGVVERDLECCRRKLKDLAASLARLESCRRELLTRLAELFTPDGVPDRGGAGGASPDGSTPGCAAPPPTAGFHLLSRQRSGGVAYGAAFPSSREEQVDCCLEMVKLRCRAMAEELAEVVLLAEALHALACKRVAAGAGGQAPAVAGAPSEGVSVPGVAGAAGAPAAASSPAAPAAPAPFPPAAAPRPAASPPAAPSASSTPAAPSTASPPGAAATEGLAAVISSPQFQKVAAQLLAQLIRK